MKLCDFGISGVLDNSKAKSRNAGVAAYMAVSNVTKLWNSFYYTEITIFSLKGSPAKKFMMLGLMCGASAYHW